MVRTTKTGGTIPHGDDGVWLTHRKKIKYKTMGTITFFTEFQLDLFAQMAKPAWELYLGLLNKLIKIIIILKPSELTTRPIPAAVVKKRI